jgi:hypothetical protein
MTANTLLSALIAIMVVRDCALWFRYRRPYRLAYAVFWTFLGYVHFANRPSLMPGVVVALVIAFWLKKREPVELAKMLARADAELAAEDQDND